MSRNFIQLTKKCDDKNHLILQIFQFSPDIHRNSDRHLFATRSPQHGEDF